MGKDEIPKGSQSNIPKGCLETYMKLATTTDLYKYFVGFDRMNDLYSDVHQQITNSYPRYNLIKVGDAGYRVEIAVPGWDISDIDITLDNNILKVEGRNKQTEKSNETYLHKGLSGKVFVRNFRVGENIKVSRAYMVNGLLCIELYEEVPEELKPRKIEITYVR